jgi:aspartate/methionine/tyrosine aminotransferase
MGLEEYYLGYVAGCEALMKPVQTMRQVISICSTNPAQWAGVAAEAAFSSGLSQYLAALLAAQRDARVMLEAEKADILGGDTAVYLTFRRPATDPSGLLEQFASQGLGVATGAAFGAPEVIRLTMAPRLGEA